MPTYNTFISKLSYKIESRWRAYLHTKKQKLFRKKVLDYHAQNPSDDIEIKQAVSYLSTHPLTNFYGKFQEKYNADDISVFTDSANGLPYIVENQKKLYFKRSQNKRTVQLMFNGLRMEQDEFSPHCYTDDDFTINTGDILADIGSAEGYLSLLNIEKLKHVYLFEQDSEWIEALEATFTPWKEKVTIVPKFVSDKNSEKEISLDTFFANIPEKPNFYKIDVEGSEKSVLNGMKELLGKQGNKIALCTYHHHNDFKTFSRFFDEKGYKHRPTPGLMIYQNDMENAQPPFFRKCMIKAQQEND